MSSAMSFTTVPQVSARLFPTAPLAFCSPSFLPKRLRSRGDQSIGNSFLSSFSGRTAVHLRLFQRGLLPARSVYVTPKAVATARNSKGLPEIPTDPPRVSLTPLNYSKPVLPVTLDLLNYHARATSRKRDSHVIASKLFRRCIKLSPSDGRAWLGLARLHSNRGDIKSARRTFREAITVCRNNPHLLQAWGVLEERQDAIERAKGLYLAALRADPSHAPAWVALGLWHQRHTRDNSSARLAFRKGAKADPSNYYVWHVWGVLEKNCRRFPTARDCFQKGVAANPTNAATYVLWGSLEDECGNSEAAIKLFEKAHSVSPNNLHAYLSHAVAAEHAGDVQKARRLLQKAIQIRPDDAAPRQALGLLEFRAGHIDEARRTFKKALEKDSKHCPSYHAWARVECAAGNLNRARRLFQESVWAAPRSPNVVRTWHSWAMMEMNAGKFDIARRFFFNGLDVDDHSVPILIGIATLEAKEGNIIRAREYMEKCVHYEPWRQSMWRAYQQLEAQFGSSHRAQLVYERSVVVGQQVEERFNLADPLPGDFQGSGMWFDALELPPDKSAFDSVGARVKQETKSASQESSEYAGTFRQIQFNDYKEGSRGATRSRTRKPHGRQKSRRRSGNLEALPSLPDGDGNVTNSMRSAYGY